MAALLSRPAWGGWIEISKFGYSRCWPCCPAPHGAGGLKSSAFAMLTYSIGSRPAWGGWIEMILLPLGLISLSSRPAWGGWIEMFILVRVILLVLSPAPHGAGGLK